MQDRQSGKVETTAPSSSSRRRFLASTAVAGGSLVLGFTAQSSMRHASAAVLPGGGTLNAWLEITADGRVRIAQPQAEMGQGIWTSMAQLIAEELEVDWESVDIHSPPATPDFAHPFYGFQTTAESFSIRGFWEPARRVGAQAREMLKQAAGERWGVYPVGLVARNGEVVEPASGRSLPYAELVREAARFTPPETIVLKRPDEWKIIGRSVARRELPAKLDGSSVFGIDVDIPDLRVAVPLFAPTLTGTVRSVDDTAALAVRGVEHVVALENVVYVVASGYWPATRGVAALDVKWDRGASGELSSEDVIETFREAARDGQGVTVETTGDADAALEAADKIVDVTLEAPYLAHATMEPMNATALYTPDKLTVWAPTQAIGLMGFVAEAVGLESHQVEAHTTFLGGGLGRRFEIDVPLHAARVSKAAGVPVKVLWPREADMRRDFYRPASVARLQAALDVDGNVTAMSATLAGSSILARAVPHLAAGEVDHTNVDGIALGVTPAGVPVHRQYAFGADTRVRYAMRNSDIPVGFWRSVAHSQNGWFMEAFVNEIALETGKDPVELRLALMPEGRNRAVLERLAERAGWRSNSPGVYQGIAVHEAFGTVLGHVIEIGLVDKVITLRKITTVADVGQAVHPDNLEAQVVSGAITGLGAALWGEVTVTNGEVEQGNFDRYRLLKLAETPTFDVEILALGGPIGGIGEPGTPPVAPALVNAIQAANGERIRRLPLAASGYDLA